MSVGRPIAAVCALLCASVLFAQTKNVNVVNTPTVNVGNTPTVNVGNVPAVTISNAPSVTVANTPNVAIANTPNVQIANTPSSPVPVLPGFQAGFQPFIMTQPLAAANGAWYGSVTVTTVPTGKMLVLQHVSARVDLASGQQVGSFSLLTQDIHGGGGFFFITPSSPRPANTGNSTFFGNDTFPAYLTPGTTVQFSFERTSNSGASVYGYVTISGYLVNAPALP